VLLSFDDSQGSQVSEGLPQLDRRSMTATFFVMTVVLGKTGWMSRDDLRRLDAAGMSIAAHTWDHHRADGYTAADYPVQFDQPRQLLEHVLRKPVRHFAYPYGAWNTAEFAPLRTAGYATAFQLSDTAMDPQEPLHTLRRILVNSTWSGSDLLTQLKRQDEGRRLLADDGREVDDPAVALLHRDRLPRRCCRGRGTRPLLPPAGAEAAHVAARVAV